MKITYIKNFMSVKYSQFTQAEKEMLENVFKVEFEIKYNKNNTIAYTENGKKKVLYTESILAIEH